MGEYLIKYYPKFSSNRFSEEAAFQVMFPKIAFNKHELTRYLSKLSTVLEKFIIVESLDKQPFLAGSLLAEYYYTTQNEAAFKKSQKTNSKTIETLVPKESAHYFFQYLGKKREHNFLMHQANKRVIPDVFGQVINSLDSYYFIEILQNATGLRSIQGIQESEPKLPLLKPTLQWVSEHLDEASPLIQLWYFAYMLTCDPRSSGAYQNLKEGLLKNLRVIPAISARSFSVLLIRAMRLQTGNDRKRYLEERFEMYQIEIQEDWIIADKIISYLAFNNIVTVSLALDKEQWAKDFIDKYGSYLIDEIRNDILLYNRARLQFRNEYYSKCLQETQKIAYLNNHLALGLKRLQLKCFFELKDYDSFFAAIHSYKAYIYRLDAGSEKTQKANIQLVKVLSRMGKLAGLTQYDQNVAASISELVNKEPYLLEKEWVIEKLSELEKGAS
ncbi:MAG: hypothetical protein AB8F95_07745 [Bacteroidia bacterium]